MKVGENASWLAFPKFSRESSAPFGSTSRHDLPVLLPSVVISLPLPAEFFHFALVLRDLTKGPMPHAARLPAQGDPIDGRPAEQAARLDRSEILPSRLD